MSHSSRERLWVYVIPADSSQPTKYVEVKNDLKSVSELVGGYIEIVRNHYLPVLPCGCRVVQVVNEEGHLDHLPFNQRATTQYYPFSLGIAGDVFLVGEGVVRSSDGSEEVDFVSLPEEYEKWQLSMIGPAPSPDSFDRQIDDHRG